MIPLDPKGLEAASRAHTRTLGRSWQVMIEEVIRAYLEAAETFHWDVGKTYELRVSTADLPETVHGVDELMAALKRNKP